MAAAVSRMLVVVAGLTLIAGPLAAQTIYPIDRAAILAGARFDFKVEFPVIEKEADLKITINGEDYSRPLGKAGQFVENEDGLNASSLVLRDAAIDKPGNYQVVASDGTRRSEVTWTVFATGPRVAKNVILFIGDGMSMANRTAARILSKGIKEGKYFGKLAMDDMPQMALIGTSGVDAITTDSANSMSAYTTGHKSSVNALGVYAARNKNNLEHPKVETIAELAKRKLDLAVGVVSDAEVQDATPAGMVAHTRRRVDKPEITQMFLDDRVDVLMGGGSAYFLPKSTPGSKRKDDKNYLELYQQAGFKLVTTEEALKATAAEPSTMKLLGLFHPENMDGALDRHILHGSTVAKYPHQPDLVDMTRAAIDVLSRYPNGFVLMVEAALIDKYLHPLDWERSVYDTIMLDNAVRLAKNFAAKNNDTLILVTPDHTHGVSLVGTIDDNNPAPEMRDKVGVYDKAGYPNYPAPDAEGYPAKVDVSKRLAIFFADFPDYYETFRPKLDKTFTPAVQNEKKEYVANEAYKEVPGAVLRVGNLPHSASDGVHSADDAVLTASGPGSERVHGFMDNTEVFQVMVNALGLGRVE
ncbi:MAG: alkaline phosphatase [Alphaproteobacteria bacterium]|nr:MAG: alkaline phosphatase [Alphaproteobacteria bacterium]